MVSICTRHHPEGPRVTPEEFLQFLIDDHLCIECAVEDDATYAQRTVASHKQSTVPEVQS